MSFRWYIATPPYQIDLESFLEKVMRNIIWRKATKVIFTGDLNSKATSRKGNSKFPSQAIAEETDFRE